MEFVTLGNALNVALLLVAGLGWRWIDRIQQQQDKLSEAIGKLKDKVLEEYAKKIDVNGGDEKILDRIKEVSDQLQRINDKLDGKKDKNDG